QLYMDYSTQIYNIYLKYIAPTDIHVYSIDEVFIDVTDYQLLYKMSARDLCMTMIREILYTTGITATGGIGSNLYLAKVAMDIVAKHVPADENGVRIAELDEISYRKLLWTHTPLTDFWQIGEGYARKLMAHGMYTMGDVARCSIGKDDEYLNEELLYKLFGIRAELLIDHAWGYEPTTLVDIRAYVPENNSLSSGQVLHCPYSYDKALLIVKEMTDLLVLALVEKGLLTDQLTLTLGYDREGIDPSYDGPLVVDYYGRLHPRHSHGTLNLGKMSSSTELIMEGMIELFRRIADPRVMVRRINITAAHILREEQVPLVPPFEQLSLFTDYEELQKARQAEIQQIKQERSLQKAMISIKNRFGKNAVLKGMNLLEGGRTIERNAEIGGHRAG
ncbi:MAG: DNA methylase, partial [Clostridiales bacterium]|nr:DNA methylase [Candidatus Blautia equi]